MWLVINIFPKHVLIIHYLGHSMTYISWNAINSPHANGRCLRSWALASHLAAEPWGAMWRAHRWYTDGGWWLMIHMIIFRKWRIGRYDLIWKIIIGWLMDDNKGSLLVLDEWWWRLVAKTGMLVLPGATPNATVGAHLGESSLHPGNWPLNPPQIRVDQFPIGIANWQCLYVSYLEGSNYNGYQ